MLFARRKRLGTPPSGRLRRGLSVSGLLWLAMLMTDPALAQTPAVQLAPPPATANSQAIEQKFLLALGLLNSGRAEDAIPLLLDILAIDPSLVRVRLELGRAYFEAEQWTRARREFFTALSTDLPEPVRLRVLALIQAIDARRGFDWDLTLGLASLGNLRRYDSDVIDLQVLGVVLPSAIDRDESTAVGARLTGAITYRRAIEAFSGPGLETVAFAGLNADVQDGPGSDLDDMTFGARAGLRILGARRSVSLNGFAQTRYLFGDAYEDRYGVELRFEQRTGSGLSVFGAASFAELDSATSKALDGHAVTAQLGVQKSLAGQATIGTSIQLEENRVQDFLNNYRDAELRVFGRFDLAQGFTVSPTLYGRYRDFPTPSPILVGDPNERGLGAILTVEKNDLFLGDGFTPFLRLQYERTKSDIDAFSYTETQLQVGLTRRF